MGLCIAIIGGGVSGLSAAYYLRQQALASGLAMDIAIYERKQLLGGNAETVAVKLGTLQGPDGQPQRDFIRWADLGVNDVNLSTYVRLKSLMSEVDYLDHMLPLQDTACYFSADGRHLLTDDDALSNGVSDPRFSLAAADEGELRKLIRVVHQRALDVVATLQPGSPTYTTGRFFADCLAAPQAQLGEAASRLGIAPRWDDPALPERLRRVRDEYYYPRISAMYFTDDVTGPAGMPLQSPFEYYRIQEGGDPPDRRYFRFGAQHWLTHLADWMTARDTDKVRVTIHRSSPVTVTISPAGAVVTPLGRHGRPVDLVLMTLPADDALAALRFNGMPATVVRYLQHTLGQVRHTRTYGVCHTDQNLLPSNRNAWRTYNVLVHPTNRQAQPYRMSYVENLHQNDPANPYFNRMGWPEFFTTLTPDLAELPPDAMLDRVTGEQVPRELAAAIPHLEKAAAHAGGMPTGLQGKAWAQFKHHVLDQACLDAQRAVAALNRDNAREPLMPLFLGGGWTHGAGLHEQCLAQSACLADCVMAYRERHLLH